MFCQLYPFKGAWVILGMAQGFQGSLECLAIPDSQGGDMSGRILDPLIRKQNP